MVGRRFTLVTERGAVRSFLSDAGAKPSANRTLPVGVSIFALTHRGRRGVFPLKERMTLLRGLNQFFRDKGERKPFEITTIIQVGAALIG